MGCRPRCGRGVRGTRCAREGAGAPSGRGAGARLRLAKCCPSAQVGLVHARACRCLDSGRQRHNLDETCNQHRRWRSPSDRSCGPGRGTGWMLSRPAPARVGSALAALHAEDVVFRSASGFDASRMAITGTPHSGAVSFCCRASRRTGSPRSIAPGSARRWYSTLLIDFQATGES